MRTLLHLSDPHFGTEQPQVVEALIRLSASQRPQVVVVSGDITQRARRAQFTAARAFLDRLAAPATLAIPGNHDIPLLNLPARVLRPYGGFVRVFGDDLAPVHDDPDLLVIGVNTTRPWRHKHGELSREQVQQVAARLRRSRSQQLKVVVVHQPVHVITPDDVVNLVRGRGLSRDTALRRLSDAGADLVLGGHIHLPFVDPVDAAALGDSRMLWVVQAGTAVSRRIRGGVPNSVNLLRHGGRHCTVERWDFHAGSDRFRQVSSQIGRAHV